ncbi:MAG: hypothetical protein K0R29_1601 [Pseudobdellovibrio sp.]|jgi:hypothetical protein|nr:hypothetical protein [Pseudobdellovibrio sp.]
MKTLLSVILLFITVALKAEIQVPEDCINKTYPCLVRADQMLEFQQAHLRVTLTPKSIIKITKENSDSQLNFELLTGRMSVKEVETPKWAISVNSVMLEVPYAMVKRDQDELDILNLSKFTKVRYSINIQNNNVPVRVRSYFLSKSEFVDFTRHYFAETKSFKNFLTEIQPQWIAEFKSQNESQTKALMRSVASEEKAAEDRVRQEQERERQIKKVKDEFFFRTFNR